MLKKHPFLILIPALLVCIFLINMFSGFLTIFGECDGIGGWGVGGQSCTCYGFKAVEANSLAADGFYITRCYGIGIVSKIPPSDF